MNLSEYEPIDVEWIENKYYSIMGFLKEYRKAGTTTITFSAIRCLQTCSNWLHVATLKSSPSIAIYTNLIPWEDLSYNINCKIEIDGNIYLRAGTSSTVAGFINYYNTINFS